MGTGLNLPYYSLDGQVTRLDAVDLSEGMLKVGIAPLALETSN